MHIIDTHVLLWLLGDQKKIIIYRKKYIVE